VSSRKKYLVEAKLSLVIFCTIVTGTANFVLLAVGVLVNANSTVNDFLFYVYLIGDVMTLCQPYLLLAFSAHVRHAVRMSIFGVRHGSDVPTATVINDRQNTLRLNRVAVNHHL
jgi:hypothetical protein